MKFFSCFSSKARVHDDSSMFALINQPTSPENLIDRTTGEEVAQNVPSNNIRPKAFALCELATVTNNFSEDCFLGEGRFGRVYKGKLETTGQVVAVKHILMDGLEGDREFLIEVLMLFILHHSNVMNLIGYCTEGEQKLLVYEYMPLGSLQHHLFDLEPNQKPLDWNTRIKIALGVAKGLEYLHNEADPPVIFRDLKPSSIMLNQDFDAKLVDFSSAKLGPIADTLDLLSRPMGTHGYSAPEYQQTGLLTLQSDVYSFGVVLLELITERRVIDTNRPCDEQNLVIWAQSNRSQQLADPLLQGEYPENSLNQAIAVTAMCLQEDPTVRPLMSDIVTALSFIGSSYIS